MNREYLVQIFEWISVENDSDSLAQVTSIKMDSHARNMRDDSATQ